LLDIDYILSEYNFQAINKIPLPHFSHGLGDRGLENTGIKLSLIKPVILPIIRNDKKNNLTAFLFICVKFRIKV